MIAIYLDIFGNKTYLLLQAEGREGGGCALEWCWHRCWNFASLLTQHVELCRYLTHENRCLPCTLPHSWLAACCWRDVDFECCFQLSLKDFVFLCIIWVWKCHDREFQIYFQLAFHVIVLFIWDYHVHCLLYCFFMYCQVVGIMV